MPSSKSNQHCQRPTPFPLFDQHSRTQSPLGLDPRNRRSTGYPRELLALATNGPHAAVDAPRPYHPTVGDFDRLKPAARQYCLSSRLRVRLRGEMGSSREAQAVSFSSGWTTTMGLFRNRGQSPETSAAGNVSKPVRPGHRGPIAPEKYFPTHAPLRHDPPRTIPPPLCAKIELAVSAEIEIL